MRNSKTYLLVFFFVVLGGLLWQLSAGKFSPSISSHPVTSHAVSTGSGSSSTAIVPAGDTKLESALVPKKKDSIQVVWEIGTPDDGNPTIPVPVRVSVYAPITINMDSPVFPDVGDRLALVLPGGGEVIVNVESSYANPNGDYTWRGHLNGLGDQYPVVMTYGSTSVFATITSPEGSYTMESVNGHGWIYKNPSEYELTQPGQDDYLEIPGRE
jgi:hypothetical protein